MSTVYHIAMQIMLIMAHNCSFDASASTKLTAANLYLHIALGGMFLIHTCNMVVHLQNSAWTQFENDDFKTEPI